LQTTAKLHLRHGEGLADLCDFVDMLFGVCEQALPLDTGGVSEPGIPVTSEPLGIGQGSFDGFL
jgi:hypothetical protein